METTKDERIKKGRPRGGWHEMDVVVVMVSVAHKKGVLYMIARTYTG